MDEPLISAMRAQDGSARFYPGDGDGGAGPTVPVLVDPQSKDDGVLSIPKR